MDSKKQITNDIHVQCTRCRNKHMESERIAVSKGSGISELVCPCCSAKSFYDVRPQIAWCWASGLIELGDEGMEPSGCIVIAAGPRAYLQGTLSAVARHGAGSSEGKLLVPGVPEADSQQSAADALGQWLAWCAKGNGRKHRYGVVFETENAED